MAMRSMNKFSIILILTSVFFGQNANAKEYRQELIEDMAVLYSQGICLSVELLEESESAKDGDEKYFYIGVSSPDTIDGNAYESNSYSKSSTGESKLSVHFIVESKDGVRYFHTYLSTADLRESFIDIRYTKLNDTGVVKRISLGKITQNGSKLYEQVPSYCRP